MLRIVSLAIGMLVLLPHTSAGQAPHRRWMTVETPNYRVHYPAEYEAWALEAARRLEAIRDRVAQAVEFSPAARADVLVMDPAAVSNGFAVPLLGSPRMVLWTTPPPPGSALGSFRSWPELLAVHEDAHLVHLLRPSRNPLSRALERTLLPLGPIARRAPRWAIEGYATMLEGQLTGAGRPHSDLRAAILRRWAQRGRLPSYARLSSDSERWQGMSMAYLAGSAYLEWLVERSGPVSLQHLWARLTARVSRRFDAAFEGVFGGSPEELYGRFAAELTERAMASERESAPLLREGELWQRLEWSTGLPAVSPDGEHLAIVIRGRERPARLVVWGTGPNERAERQAERRIGRMLERDPEDVPPVRSTPLPREPVAELPAVNGGDPESPRWAPDGESILFVRTEPDAEGVLHPDIFRWFPRTGRVERITRLADVGSPDPSPDGHWAAAVRQRFGFSGLVRVDLQTGLIEELTEPSIEIVYATPRFSPEGRRLAYLRHEGGRWRAIVRDLESGTERELQTEGFTTIAHPAWSRDGGTVFLVAGAGGFIDIHAFPAQEERDPFAVTRTHGAALGPEPSPDGRLYFLGLEPHGLDVRRVQIGRAPGAAAARARAELGPGGRRGAAEPRPFSEHPVALPRRYGIGRQEFMPIFGGIHAPSGRLFEAGVRGGDVVGRLSYLAAAALSKGEGSAEGAAFAGSWRGAAPGVRVHAFSVHERASAQPVRVPGLGTALDARRNGIEAAVEHRRRLGRPVRVGGSAGALVGRVEPAASAAGSQRILYGEAVARLDFSRGRFHQTYGAEARLDDGVTAGAAWRRTGFQAHAGVGYGRTGARYTLDRRRVTGSPSPIDLIQVGGVPGTVVPPALAAGRASVPVLPSGTLVGDRYERQRIDVTAIGPFPVFFERHRVWSAGEGGEAVMRLVGTEMDLVTAPLPIVRLPAARVRVGAARLLDPPFARDTRWWFSLAWKP